jgi:quercetin dioxygenase-like cupin family protein
MNDNSRGKQTMKRRETSRNPVVLRPRALAVIDRGGGVRTVHLVTADLGSQFVNGTTEFDPGASLPLHSHNCEESVVILEGDAALSTAR